MFIVAFMLLAGFVIGMVIPYKFPVLYSMYFSVGILAALDSIFGAIRASYEDKFRTVIFLTGFLSNIVLAMFLSFLGERLGVPLYYAAIFVFGTRLFANLARIRRFIVEKILKK